ncbi:hypothetical protein E4V42_05190 [Clostridium estertheticum]|uniref:Uncharacterized protein n=1 Tax=Clostridium estertheticum TaxID=238834 RepID=A0A5N7IKJ3_9CLOT|nr:hypothetical protein [Clostridium estertheticum]MPQ30830.1 hypothetical protein [Clostridium estertheticum]MPQ61506.1 hypothetical protein [Clostridium estertheticum]
MDRANLKASIVIAIIGIILISVIYFRPVSINRNYSGYMYDENSKLDKVVEINLDGELKKNLSLNYVFTGSIEVDGLKKQVVLKRIWAKYNVFKTVEYSAFIETKNDKTGQYEVNGTVNTSKNFNEILIKLDDVDSKYNSKFDICGPSNTREEAKGIITKLEKND